MPKISRTLADIEYVREFSKLQPLPEIAVRVMRITNTGEASFARLADLVRSDPAFSSEVLRLANSAAIGCRGRIQNIQHALILLGLERLKSLVLTVALRNFMAARLKVPVLRRCWLHSIASAVAAEQVAAACRQDRDTSYTAGLLHDVGRLGLLVTYPAEYAAMLAEAGAQEIDLRERERELFGADHCEAGRILAEMHRFPEELAAIVAHHHDPPPAVFDLSAATQLACRLAGLLGFAACGAEAGITREDLRHAYPHCNWDALPEEPQMRRKIKALDASF